MDDADDKEREALLLRGLNKPQFHYEDWRRWLQLRYRQPLDPRRDLERFWYRTGDKHANDAWLADLFALPNWSLLSHYINIGISLMLGGTPVTYYLVMTLKASAATVNTYAALTYLPWCLKFFYGLQTDLVPLCGVHRRSYYCLGWLIYVVCNVWLALLKTPDTTAILLLSFGYTAGFMLADVVADALILECSQVGEDSINKGRMRTHAYYVRAVGMAIGALAGAGLWNGPPTCSGDECWAWGLDLAALFWVQGGLVLVTILPLMLTMYELPIRTTGVASDLTTLWNETFEFLKHDGVWIPLMFLFFYNFCFVANPAWNNFLFLGLGFTNFGYGMLAFAGALLSVAGLWAYEKFFFRSSWRQLYLWVTFIVVVFSFLQVLLVLQATWLFSPYAFALGDTRVVAFVQPVAFLPMGIMSFPMIPAGAEGTVYALLSTWQNVATEAGYQLGTYLTCVTDVSDSAIEDGKWAGVLKLTIICSAVQILPIFLIYTRTPGGICLLPDSVDATKAQCDRRKSAMGPWLFYALFFGAVAFSLGQSLWLAVNPGGLCPGGDDDGG